MAVHRLREAYADDLARYRCARSAAAKQQLLAAAAQALLTHSADAEAAALALGQLHLRLSPQEEPNPAAATAAGTIAAAAAADGVYGSGAAAAAVSSSAANRGPTAVLLEQVVTLQRSDVPLLLDCLQDTTNSASSQVLNAATEAGAPATAAAAAAAVDGSVASAGSSTVTPSMLRAMVVGGWTTQGPQALRRASNVLQLCLAFQPSCLDLIDAIKAAEMCSRPAGKHNRHGHSRDLQYPSPAGWSPEYQQAREAAMAQVSCPATTPDWWHSMG